MNQSVTLCFPDAKNKNKNKAIHMIISAEEKPHESCETLYWFPQYLNEVSTFRNLYNTEWNQYLLKKNWKAVKNSVKFKSRFTFYTPKIVRSIFNVCKLLRQPPEVRYIAVEIFDGFLVEHFSKVSKAFVEMKDEGSDTWQAIVDRMLKQSPLRILTSVQLAMKYAWRHNVFTVADIQDVLKFLGFQEHLPKRSILKSEARVYQHLNYNIPSKTPFTYLEMFFDYFQNREFLDLKISLHNFFNTCIHVLDMAIIFHHQIYGNLAEKKFETPEINRFIPSIKENYVVLAASVIFTSSILADPNMAASKTFLQKLCSVGECKKLEVEELGKELINIIYATEL